MGELPCPRFTPPFVGASPRGVVCGTPKKASPDTDPAAELQRHDMFVGERPSIDLPPMCGHELGAPSVLDLLPSLMVPSPLGLRLMMVVMRGHEKDEAICYRVCFR